MLDNKTAEVELKDIIGKITQAEYFINRTIEFGRLSEEAKNAKFKVLDVYNEIQNVIIKNSNIDIVQLAKIEHQNNPLKPFTTDSYRYRFGKTVVPVGELFGKDLVIESIDVSIDSDVYTIPLNYYIPEDGKIDYSGYMAVIPGMETFPGKDGFQRQMIYLTGKYSKGDEYSNGGLVIHAKAVYHGDFALLSYTLKSR